MATAKDDECGEGDCAAVMFGRIGRSRCSHALSRADPRGAGGTFSLSGAPGATLLASPVSSRNRISPRPPPIAKAAFSSQALYTARSAIAKAGARVSNGLIYKNQNDSSLYMQVP